MSENRTARAAASHPHPAGPNFPVPSHRPEKPRLHAVDALRGTAIFFVVTLHAALAYTQLDIPRLVWGVRDRAPHLGFDWLCWGLMGTSVPLFFAISGFLSAEIYEGRGPAGFLKNRAGRILGPFVAGLVIVGPSCFYAWSYGWLVTGRCTLREITRIRFRDPVIEGELLGAGHLWFLLYLVPMLAAYWAVRRYRLRLPSPGRWIDALWLPLVLAIPSAVLLWASRKSCGIDAALDRHNSFLWNPLRLLHHGSFFAMGAALRHLRPDLRRLADRGWIYLLAAVPVFAVRANLLQRDFSGGLSGSQAVILAAAGGVLSWLTTLGLIGVYRRLVTHRIAPIRYLADSSYWIYLTHMPLVGLIQADLYRVDLPRSVKFALVLATTLAIGLGSYETLVRRTFVGRFLSGGKRPPSPVASQEKATAA